MTPSAAPSGADYSLLLICIIIADRQICQGVFQKNLLQNSTPRMNITDLPCPAQSEVSGPPRRSGPPLWCPRNPRGAGPVGAPGDFTCAGGVNPPLRQGFAPQNACTPDSRRIRSDTLLCCPVSLNQELQGLHAAADRRCGVLAIPAGQAPWGPRAISLARAE